MILYGLQLPSRDCIVCLALPTEQVEAIPVWFRQLLRLPEPDFDTY